MEDMSFRALSTLENTENVAPHTPSSRYGLQLMIVVLVMTSALA